MRLTKKHKEILACSLSLNVEEMPDGETRQLAIEILESWQQKGVWGNCDGFFPEVEDDE